MPVVRGIDVSAYQTVDYATVARHVRFVIVKATEGTHSVSSAWTRHWTGAGKAGLIRGSYHIAHPEQGHSPQAEADHYVATLRAAGWRSGWDLPPVLDIEPGSAGYGRSRLTEWALAFMRRVDEALGLEDPWLRCGIYVGDSIRNAVDLGTLHRGRWYWRGGYGSTWPTEVPSGCAMYQRVAPVSAVPGVRGNSIDIDVVRPNDFARMVPRHHQESASMPEEDMLNPDDLAKIRQIVREEVRYLVKPGPAAQRIAGDYSKELIEKGAAVAAYAVGADARTRALVRAVEALAAGLGPTVEQAVRAALADAVVDVDVTVHDKSGG